MSLTIVFLSGISIVTLLFIGTVLYIRNHLRALLVELCGTPERARFWLAFSNVTLVLVPLIFALDYKPEIGPDRSSVFEIGTQLKHAIIGFVIALSSLAFILFRFIPRDRPNAAADAPR